MCDSDISPCIKIYSFICFPECCVHTEKLCILLFLALKTAASIISEHECINDFHLLDDCNAQYSYKSDIEQSVILFGHHLVMYSRLSFTHCSPYFLANICWLYYGLMPNSGQHFHLISDGYMHFIVHICCWCIHLKEHYNKLQSSYHH